MFFELTVEIRQTVKSVIETYLQNTFVGVNKVMASFSDPIFNEIGNKGFLSDFFEKPAKGRYRHIHTASYFLQVNPLRIVIGDIGI